MRVEVIDRARATWVIYVRVSLAPVEFCVMDEVTAICGENVAMTGWEPVVMCPAGSRKRKIFPVTTQEDPTV